MTYKIYTTEGIVLSSRDTGEADRIFSIYTKDFGRLDILARGVRYLKSKLRYHLKLFSCLEMAFIRGEDFLRLVDAREKENCGAGRLSKEKFESFSRMAGLINRMVKGEEEESLLWREIRDFFNFFQKEEIKKEGLKIIELLAAFRLLYFLGYVDGKEGLASFLKGELADFSDTREAMAYKPKILQAIRTAIRESQL